MRILILSPYYDPYQNPRSYRANRYAHILAQKGYKVCVLTSNRSQSTQPTHENITIETAGFNSIKEIYFSLTKGKKERSIAEPKDKSRKYKSSRILRSFIQLNNLFIKKIYWPDDAFIWQRPAIKKALSLLSTHQFDAVISFSLPFSTNLVGQKIKHAYPSLKWLIDMGDPFSFQKASPVNNTFLYKNKNMRVEKKVLSQADYIILTNESILQKLQFNLGIPKGKLLSTGPMISFPNLWSKSPEKTKKDTLKLSYMGSFFKNIREPQKVLAAFDQLIAYYPHLAQEMEIHIYGDIFDNFNKDFNKFPSLKNLIFFHGLINNKEIHKAYSSSNILFNVGNKSNDQLPSKCVDYLYSAKPIINFRQIEEDLSSSFFHGHPYMLDVDLFKLDNSIHELYSFISSVKNKRVSSNWVEAKCSPFYPQNIVGQVERTCLRRETKDKEKITS